MNDRTQEQLDEFAQKLGTLNLEFEQLKRSVSVVEAPVTVEATPEPPVQRRTQIQEIDDLFGRG